MMTIRYLGGALAVAALILLSLGERTPAHAGFTKLVDQDPNGCQNATTVYPTITEALNDQQSGDVIYVCPGTYVEPTLVLSTNLTLTGPESGGVIIQMANPTLEGRAIFVNTNNSVVTHLEIDATAPAGYVGQTTGLRDGGDHNVFSHLTITNADYGIDIQGSEPLDNVVTENNVTARIQAISVCCGDSFVTNNSVQSPDSDEITGIFVTGNNFTVSGNTLTRAQLGANGTNGSITDNHVIGNGDTDYDLVGLYNGPITLADNVIENAGRNAIGIYAPYFDTNVTIVRNTIRDARIGILTQTQNNYQIHAVVGGSEANANTFIDSGGTLDDANYLFQQGVDVNSIDATFNDWGLCSAADIEKEIYHSEDNGTLTTVQFEPFVAGPSCATPTPPPTATPTAPPSATAPPTASPTATPGLGLQWGDFTCNGTLGPEDGLAIVVHVAELGADQQEPCPDISGRVQVNETARPWADFDCDGNVDFDDMLKLLAALADLPYEAEPGCPDAGEVVDVVGPNF